MTSYQQLLQQRTILDHQIRVARLVEVRKVIVELPQKPTCIKIIQMQLNAMEKTMQYYQDRFDDTLDLIESLIGIER